MNDITSNLRQRLLVLIDQVQRDRASLVSPAYVEGDRLHARLFDVLHAALHNLDRSMMAEKQDDQF